MDDILCDVLVVGSGASGFATALTARHLGLDVLIAEKEPVFGGTTCFSAGVVWIPSNSPARQAQIEDSEKRALCYLRQEAGNHLNETIASAYLANAPKMLDFFTANTHVRFDLLPTMPDYHAEFAGGVGGGRSLRPQVFDGRRLGKWFEKLRPPTKPGFIVVDKGGRRFANETAPYHDFVPAMIEACRNQDELEAFIICDNRAIRRYGVGAVPPAPLRLKPFVDSGYIFRSSTIRDLAHRGRNQSRWADTRNRRLQPPRPRGQRSRIRQGLRRISASARCAARPRTESERCPYRRGPLLRPQNHSGRHRHIAGIKDGRVRARSQRAKRGGSEPICGWQRYGERYAWHLSRRRHYDRTCNDFRIRRCAAPCRSRRGMTCVNRAMVVPRERRHSL